MKLSIKEPKVKQNSSNLTMTKKYIYIIEFLFIRFIPNATNRNSIDTSHKYIKSIHELMNLTNNCEYASPQICCLPIVSNKFDVMSSVTSFYAVYTNGISICSIACLATIEIMHWERSVR